MGGVCGWWGRVLCCRACRQSPSPWLSWPTTNRTCARLLACLQAVGRTRHNKLCYFPGDGAALKGRMVDVHIDRVHAYTLYGRQLD